MAFQALLYLILTILLHVIFYLSCVEQRLMMNLKWSGHEIRTHFFTFKLIKIICNNFLNIDKFSNQ